MLLSSIILTKIYRKYNNMILIHFLKDPVNECLKSLVNVDFFFFFFWDNIIIQTKDIENGERDSGKTRLTMLSFWLEHLFGSHI